MAKAKTQLQILTEAVEKLINNPVAVVAPVAPVLPIAPVAPVLPINTGDHDIITGLVKDVANIDKKVDGLILTVEKISQRDGLYLLKEDFVFWRNLLVLSMVGTIFVSIILKFINN